MMDEQFSNEQLSVTEIPQSGKLNFISLEKDYLKVNMISRAIFCVILISGTTIAFFQLADIIPDWHRYLILLAPIVLSTLLMFLAYKGYWYKAYALRAHDIVYKTGYIYRSKIIIPFNRVQHCEVNQGPIDRLFNLSELKVFTAGGSSSDMKIPGLKPEEANTLKQFIARKTGDGISEEE